MRCNQPLFVVVVVVVKVVVVVVVVVVVPPSRVHFSKQQCSSECMYCTMSMCYVCMCVSSRMLAQLLVVHSFIQSPSSLAMLLVSCLACTHQALCVDDLLMMARLFFRWC